LNRERASIAEERDGGSICFCDGVSEVDAGDADKAGDGDLWKSAEADEGEPGVLSGEALEL